MKILAFPSVLHGRRISYKGTAIRAPQCLAAGFLEYFILYINHDGVKVTQYPERMNAKVNYNVAVLPGDGIGPEVTAEAVRVLDALVTPRFVFTELSVGAGQYLRSGDPLPPETREQISQQDAVLLGAMGLPNVRWPTGVEMTPQLDLREELDLYCGLRPIYLYHGEDSPLRRRYAGDIDLLIVRESTEGYCFPDESGPAIMQPKQRKTAY